MLPKIKIGTVSRLAGIAPETIRHYERKHIICPSMNAAGQREYDITDVCVLLRTREYLKYGFSLDEIRCLLACSDPVDMLAQLDGQSLRLEEELEQCVSALRSLHQRQALIHETQALRGVFRLESCPEMLLLDEWVDNRMLEEFEECAVCTADRLSDSTFSFLRFLQSDIETGVTRRFVGTGCLARDARILSSPPREPLRFAARPCLHTALVMPSSRKNLPVEELLKAPFDYMRAQGLHLAGDVLCRTVFLQQTGEETFYHRLIWLPVES